MMVIIGVRKFWLTMYKKVLELFIKEKANYLKQQLHLKIENIKHPQPISKQMNSLVYFKKLLILMVLLDIKK